MFAPALHIYIYISHKDRFMFQEYFFSSLVLYIPVDSTHQKYVKFVVIVLTPTNLAIVK